MNANSYESYGFGSDVCKDLLSGFSLWEAGLIVTAHLENLEIEIDAFYALNGCKIRDLLDNLRRLPDSWAKHFCNEVLMDIEKSFDKCGNK